MGGRDMKFGHIVVVTIAFALALTISCTASSPMPVPTPTPTPIIDAHVHLPRGLTLDHLIKLMDETGVWMSVVMPVFFSRQDQ
jgi:hypothetical protein